MHSREAHTAEHIFMGSLQRLVSGISVRKVVHEEMANKVYIRSAALDLDAIYAAEVITNKIIGEGRKVKEHSFQSMEDAKKAFPQMRAYEERISGAVRMVEIDGHDYAACAREHAESTDRCGFFLIRHVSREKDEYQIEFLVGKQAEQEALEMSMKCIRVASELGASMDTLPQAARNLRQELDTHRQRLVRITENLVDALVPMNKHAMSIYAAVFDMLDDDTLVRKAGDIIKKPDTAVLFINTNGNARIILACNDRMTVTCNAMLASALTKFGGKGGGKLNFATGSVPSERTKDVFDVLLQSLEN